MILNHHSDHCTSAECHSLGRMGKAKAALLKLMAEDRHTTPLEWARVLTETSQACIRQELGQRWEEEP